MVALVRMFGHRELPIEEARGKVRILIERYGQGIIMAASDEIVEQEGRGNVQIVRLTERARNLAIQLIGRAPTEESSVPLPTSAPEKPAVEARESSDESDSDGGVEADTEEDEPIEETTESETPSEDHILLTPATEATVEGEPVNLPRETVLERFVAALDAIDQDFTLPTDEIKAELGGEHLGTL
ncbi:MAG: hypothetical protein HZA46_23300, partial [Planctomycetales bacterium]|nr:hypothetical protein [Planctomycetales bacterium]